MTCTHVMWSALDVFSTWIHHLCIQYIKTATETYYSELSLHPIYPVFPCNAYYQRKSWQNLWNTLFKYYTYSASVSFCWHNTLKFCRCRQCCISCTTEIHLITCIKEPPVLLTYLKDPECCTFGTKDNPYMHHCIISFLWPVLRIAFLR